MWDRLSLIHFKCQIMDIKVSKLIFKFHRGKELAMLLNLFADSIIFIFSVEER